MTAFVELGLLPELAKAFEELNKPSPSALQTKAIPLLLGDGDVLIRADNEAARWTFCAPLLQHLWELLKRNEDTDQSDLNSNMSQFGVNCKYRKSTCMKKGIKCCQQCRYGTYNNISDDLSDFKMKKICFVYHHSITKPSEEQAHSTFNVIRQFLNCLKISTLNVLLTAGLCKSVKARQDYKKHVSILEDGAADIVIGTPERIKMLSIKGHLVVSDCQLLIVNDAYRILRQKNYWCIHKLREFMPKVTSDGHKSQMVVCSFAIHALGVKKMTNNLIPSATAVDLNGNDPLPDYVYHAVVIVDPEEDCSWQNLDRHIATDESYDTDDTNLENCAANVISENTEHTAAENNHAAISKNGENATSDSESVNREENSQDNKEPFKDDASDMLRNAVKVLKGEYCIRAINVHKMDKALIFCRSEDDCGNLEKYMMTLDSRKYSCACVHYGLNSDVVTANIKSFREGKVKFLISTNRASRKLEGITGLPFMINMALPEEEQHYHQKILDHVGSEERMGLVISFVSRFKERAHRGWHYTKTIPLTKRARYSWHNEPQNFVKIEEHLNITIPRIKPDMQVPSYELDGKIVYGDEYKLQEVDDAEQLPKLGKSADQHSVDTHVTTREPTPLEGDEQEKSRNSKTDQFVSRKRNILCAEAGSTDTVLEWGEPPAKQFKPTSSSGTVLEEEPLSLKRLSLEDSAPDHVPKKPRSNVGKTSTGVRASEIITAILHPNYPAENFDDDQLVALRQSILNAVDEIPSGGPQVRFRGCTLPPGWFFLSCIDRQSFSWLESTMDKLKPWDDAQLKLTHEDDLPRSVFVVYIPDDPNMRLTPDKILRRLGKMNQGLYTRSWKVTHQRKSDTGQTLTLSIDMLSLPELVELNFEPFYNFGRLHFQRRETFSPP